MTWVGAGEWGRTRVASPFDRRDDLDDEEDNDEGDRVDLDHVPLHDRISRSSLTSSSSLIFQRPSSSRTVRVPT